LTKSQDQENIIINRPGRSTYPQDKSVLTSEATPLLDLRKTSSFRGEGSLLKIASERLSDVWASGTAEAASAAVHAFYTEYRTELLAAMPATTERAQRRAWEQSIASWLYDTSHIEVRYSVRYNNTAIEKLSPGTRGIVLLLLYLVLDRGDRRPLIIDQPEENLDPQSVFSELAAAGGTHAPPSDRRHAQREPGDQH
jgi:hypothetical protein